MQLVVLSMFVLSLLNQHFLRYSGQASEFNLDGDYLIGGLFPVHYASGPSQTRRPETVNCLKEPLLLRGYKGLQVMRFAVEEINNSSTLLPNVTLGYHLFDHCSDAHSFPDVLQLLSFNGSVVHLKQPYTHHHSQIIGFIGAFSSTETITLAPMFMMDLIPMISYGASTSTLSDKLVYPSFIRTTPSNRNQIELIIHIIKHFGWNWVAFIGFKSDYSENGVQLFAELIKNTGICLGYQELLEDMSRVNKTLDAIHRLHINVIVLFIDSPYAEELIISAVQLNIHKKVWIASDAWSMSNHLLKLQGIETIGTVIGVTPTVVPLSGFNRFIYQSQNRGHCVQSTKSFCNQGCDNSSSVSPEDIITGNPIFAYPTYSAVYTLAKALHNALQCNNSGCNMSGKIYPYMLLEEIKHLQFPLNEFIITFDKSLDPPARYSILLWDTSHQPVKICQIGSYTNYPVSNLTIHDMDLHWHGIGGVPFSNCSVGCKPGYVRQQDNEEQCCFICVQCPKNQYANHTADLYSCLKCDKYEWSDPGSTSCQKRSIEYLHFSDSYSIVLLATASSFILLCLGVAVLFAIHRATPVVRSAGGSMCFLMLGCLTVSVTSVFFYFSEPTDFSCIYKETVFDFFYTVCLACLFVRSFQIICIFKMAAHLPKAHAWWVKHNGQWLVVAAVSLLQFLFCVIWTVTSAPLPSEDTSSFKDQIILECSKPRQVILFLPTGLMWLLSGLCFCFSYMGTDLPKNYNEAKAITFSMLLFCLSWATFYTASLMSHTKYVQVMNIVVILSCLYGIMFSYFIPKSVIIVFLPMKNTQEYFQASIQTYTKTISRM